MGYYVLELKAIIGAIRKWLREFLTKQNYLWFLDITLTSKCHFVNIVAGWKTPLMKQICENLDQI